MIEILRLARHADLITAEVFEELFTREFGREFAVRSLPLVPWCRSVLGPPASEWGPARAAQRFAAATRNAHFLCPNWEAIVLAPLLIALRNRGRAPIRLLLIAHAPGAYAFEWALLRPLLRPGDLIVAPSDSAKATIECLCRDLAPWIRVIPHPMAPLPAPDVRTECDARLVSLGRITAGKLLHRQIDAIDVLRSRRRPLPVMDIAGAIEDASRPGRQPYARALTERIHRLHLDDRVRLVGPIRGSAAKAQFLSGASLLLNLSVTAEESFGKAPVEALGLGVPVVGTRWDGLPETIGSGGALVPVTVADRVPVDVSAEAIADAIEQLLTAPPSRDACAEQAARFAPAVILPRYRTALEEAIDADRAAPHGTALPSADEPAAAAEGLLSLIPPLTRMSWTELFDHYVETCPSVRASWEGATSTVLSTGDRLRGLIMVSTRRPIERFLAGGTPAPIVGNGLKAVPYVLEAVPSSRDFNELLAAGAAAPGPLGARLACLGEVRSAGRLDLLTRGVQQLEREGVRSAGLAFLRAEARCLAGEFEAAFDVCHENLDLQADSDITANALRQLARIARAWQRPLRALPMLVEWLDRFPDAPDAGPVWLDRSVNALKAADATPADLDDARVAIERARALLGDLPVVEKADTLLALRSVTAA